MRRALHPVLLAAALLLPLGARAAPDALAETQIHLSETATRMIAPDRLTAALRLEVKGADPRQIQAELNRRMSAALDKAKSVRGVTASAGQYQVVRTYESGVPTGWEASETLALASGDRAAVLGLAGELQAAGLALNGIDFSLAPETVKAAEGPLTAAAIAALKQRAEAVAKAFGMTVGTYKRITVGNATTGGGPVRPMPMFAMSAARAAAPPVAEATDETVSLTVSADIVLAPQK